jgi:aerobic carbon-monoxide dehydrogenase small subunit
MKHKITLHVNGEEHQLEVESRRLLSEALRDDLGLKGTKEGCETNICGSCTVHLDGESVHSCCVLAVHADGKQITTIEGLSSEGELHPVQKAFLDNLGFQCGFCTPGMIMNSVTLLHDIPQPSTDDVKRYLTGNICRCTGYVKIVKSVMAAAEKMDSQ